MTELSDRLISLLGLAVMVLVAWAASSDRRATPWRTVAWGLGLQFGLAVILLRTDVGGVFFEVMRALTAGITAPNTNALPAST